MELAESGKQPDVAGHTEHGRSKMMAGIRQFVGFKIAIAVLAGLLFMAALTPDAYADALGTLPGGGGASTSGNSARSDVLQIEDANGSTMKCSDYGALTAAIVPCIMHSIETTGVKIAEAFSDMLKPVVGAFLTLVVIFFGVKVVQGEGQVGQKALLLVVKIAFVLGFLQLMPSLIPQVHAVMKEGVTIAAETLSDPADFHCEYTVRPGGDLLWTQMDCLIGKLFGFVTGENGQPNMLLAASGFGLLGGFLFGGTFGFFVFFAMLSVLYTLLTFVWKTLLAYVNGFIVATLLIIIAPIFLPLALTQVTAQYFDKWWKGILAAIMMPTLITSYVALALLLYDKVLLSPDSLVQQLFDRDVMQEMQQTNQQMCAPMAVNDQAVSQAQAQANNITPEQRALDPNVLNRIYPLLSGNSGMCATFDPVRMPAETLTEIFYDLAKILITTIVISSGFKIIQSSVRNITGSSMVSAAIEPVSSLETRMRDAMQTARSSLNRAVAGEVDSEGRQVTGTDFITRVLPNALSGAARGFTNTVGRPTDTNG